MPIINIPNQPLAFGALTPTDNCDCENEYGYLLSEQDTIYAQFRQTPCGDDLLCDGSFNGTLGETEQIGDTDFSLLSGELITNGSFTGNANNWSLSNFSYGSDKITKTNNTVQGEAEQFLSNTLVKNAIYKVQFTVSGHSGGSIRCGFRSPSDNIDIWSSGVTGNGTFTFYLKNTGNSTILFRIRTIDNSWVGDIDNITVKRIASLWDFGNQLTMTENTGEVITIGTATQSFNYGGTLMPNTPYQVEIEFDGNGVVGIEVGGTLSTTQTVSGNQTKLWTITSGSSNTFKIRLDAGYNGSIISVSVKNINSTCWALDTTEWVTNQGSLCKVQGSASSAINSTIIAAGLYQCFITIEGMTAGLLTVSIDTETHTITTNGTHELYFKTTNNGQLIIYANAQFDGCISSIMLYELKTYYQILLKDQDNNQIADLSGYATYYNDYITLAVKLTDIDSADISHPSGSIPFGCYIIELYDECDIQYQQIWNDNTLDNPKWVWWDLVINNPNITMNIAGGQMIVQATSPANGVFYFIKNYIIPFGVSQDFIDQIPVGAHNYRVRFDIISNSDPVNITVGAFAGGSIGSYGGSNPGTYQIDILNYDPNISNPPSHYVWLVVRFMNNTTGTVVLDNLRLNRIEPFRATSVSRNILYRSHHPCTNVIRAWAEKESHNFEFINTGFYLQQRLPVKALIPEYQQQSSQYLHSTGVKTINASQNDKQWMLVLDYSPVEVHDAMALQKAMQHFEIDSGSGFISYVPEAGDYSPEWNTKISTKIATSRFRISKKDATTFMRI